MTGPVVASAAVEIVPSADSFFPKLRAQLLPQADKLGQQIGDSISRPIADKIKAAIGVGLDGNDTAGKGSRSGADYGDAFGRSVRDRLEAAFKTLPAATVNLNTTAAEAKLAEVRATLVGLTDKDYLSLHVDDATTLRSIAALKLELDALTGPEHDIRVRVNAGAASAELAALQVQLSSLAGSGSSVASAGESGAGLSQLLAPAAGAAALGLQALIPIAAVGGGAIATLLLGAKGLEGEIKSGLTPAFTQLESTATAALGPGFGQAVASLQTALPKLNPLLATFGTAIGHEASLFASWLNTDGLPGFVNYADQELPKVEQLFNNGAKAAANFFSANGQNADGLISGISGVLKGLSAGGNTSPISIASKLYRSNPIFAGLRVAGDVGQGLGDVRDWFKNGPAPKVSSPAPFLNSQALNTATSGLDAGSQQTLAMASALGETVTQYQAAASAAAADKVATAADTAEMVAANNAAGLLSQSLQGLGGDSLGVAQAQTQLKTGNLTLSATLKSNKDSLNESTAAGLADESALQAQVSAAQAVYQATAQQTGSTVQAKAAYDASIVSIENATGATGAQRQAIDDYITKIGQIPAVKMTQLEIDAQLNVTTNLLDTYNLGKSLHDVVNSANGNVISFFANGAENHVAQVATGATRVWNEPETGGEAYIPLSMSKRARSSAILADVARRFGGSYRAFDNGGIVSGPSTGMSSSAHCVHVTEVMLDGKVLTKVVTEDQGYNAARR